jgi:hypothetical protein
MGTESDNQREVIKATARSIQEFAKEQMDVDLDFDSESVKWLDGYIEEIRKQYDAASTANLIAAFGAYFGEALIQNYGGEW